MPFIWLGSFYFSLVELLFFITITKHCIFIKNSSMKSKIHFIKSLLLILCFFTSLTSYGQILFKETFDGVGGPTDGGPGTYKFPDGWLLRNSDGRSPDNNVKYINNAWERREDFNSNPTDSAAFSTSWYNPAGQADDWMWTPAIVLPSGENPIKLKWKAVTYDPLFRDGYEVRIMISPNIPTGGTGDLGNQVTHSTLLWNTTAENSSWTDREVDLNAYKGRTVRIAFRNNSTDKFILAIDDVIVERSTSLPVTLIDYTAKNHGNTALLNWQTGTEFNNKQFKILRSSNGKEFSLLATINSKGNSNNRYSFIDEKPLIGINYYQLQQEDYNGDTENLGTKSLDFSLENVNAYPNPTNNILNISFPKDKYSEVKLLTANGNTVLSQKILPNSSYTQIDMTKITKGIYLISLIGETTKNLKIVKE